MQYSAINSECILTCSPEVDAANPSSTAAYSDSVPVHPLCSEVCGLQRSRVQLALFCPVSKFLKCFCTPTCLSSAQKAVDVDERQLKTNLVSHNF